MKFARHYIMIGVALAAAMITLMFSLPSDDIGPLPRPSGSIADSRSRGRLHKVVSIVPKVIHFNGSEIEFDEAWIEKAMIRRRAWLVFSCDEPVGYFFLCFTLQKGKEPFAGASAPFFVLNDRGASFGSMNGSDIFWTDLPTVERGEKRIYLLSSWRDPRNTFVNVRIE